jgi:signal peptidase I
MAKKDDQAAPRDPRRQVRDIADSLAIAFILAMIIRHYVLEVFKIPTKSMEPTLLGDQWTGDKILVNKFAYDFRDPRRWEVAVFKYPEDVSKNYIKRVVGLPGERIQIRQGDIYINGEIERKPWSAQQALWRRAPPCKLLPKALQERDGGELALLRQELASFRYGQSGLNDPGLVKSLWFRRLSEPELRARGMLWLNELTDHDIHWFGCLRDEELSRLRQIGGEEARWLALLEASQTQAWLPDDYARWGFANGEIAIACESRPEPSILTYGRETIAYEPREPAATRRPGVTTSDIMVQFHLVPRKLAGTVGVEIDVWASRGYGPDPVDRWSILFPLGAAASGPQVYRSGQEFARGEPCTFEAGKAALVQVCNVDRALIVRVDGREVVRKAYGPEKQVTEMRGYEGMARVRLVCRQCQAGFRDPAVYVDVYYTDHPSSFGVLEPYQLKADEFFALGDNSINSKDSREWRIVPRSYLVGKAFVVLWPLGRVRIVR